MGMSRSFLRGFFSKKAKIPTGRGMPKNDLRIKESGFQDHPNGTVWVSENPFELKAFKHFSGGCIAILENKIPELVYVAGLHGWTVTRVSADEKTEGER